MESGAKASPLARRIARERGVDLESIAGTGPQGRIVAADVEGAAALFAPAPATSIGSASDEIEVVPLTPMRKTIARRLPPRHGGHRRPFNSLPAQTLPH